MNRPILAMTAALTLTACTHASDDIRALIEDLRDDEVRLNASEALRALASTERPALDELHDALDSDDAQQRQLACHVLWNYLEPHADGHRLPKNRTWRRVAQGELTDRMIEVTVEGLRDDGLPVNDDGRGMWYPNGAHGLHRLARHAETARVRLEAALASDDRQQRLLAALARARGGVSGSADKVLPILLPHLRDNDIEKDAHWCAHAIFQLGEAARPALERTRRDTDDPQQKELVTLILMHLDGPAETRAETRRRERLNTITDNARDPVIEDPARWDMAWLMDLTD
ncbi:MAG: hypothetical protein AAGH64_06380 [Planctomycetota bacterium]